MSASSPAPMSGATDGAARYVGPFDLADWPTRLAAHVVSPDEPVRIHGYAVADDLARHYSVTDVTWLTLRGDLPTAVERAAFDAALVLLAPVHVGQAPAHAAVLARIAGAPPGANLAIGAVGLGEQARHERELLAPWSAWLDAPVGPVPACALTDAPEPDVRRMLDERMRGWFGRDRGLPDAPLSRLACGHALLHRLGLRGALVIETVLVWARLPAVIAEAARVRAGAIRGYPTQLPDYQYVDDQGASP